MSSYIDADMLINGFISKLDDEETLFNQVARRFIRLLRNLPSIDIVRCKECKKRDTKECSLSWVTEWGEWEIGHCLNDDWFCGDAERESDE